ncbi:hypothetical protein Trydic_g19453 [Trypoxylus dichotomus]
MEWEPFLRQKFEIVILELSKLNEHVNLITNTLREIQLEPETDLAQSMAEYKESKQNLLKAGDIQLIDKKFQEFSKQYETVKKNKRNEILQKLCEVHDLSQSRMDLIIKNTKEFVRDQEKVLKGIDLKALEEVAKCQDKFSKKIKKRTAFCDAVHAALKVQKGKVKMTINFDVEDDSKNETSVVFYELKEIKDSDLSLVKCFLTHLKFERYDILCTRRLGPVNGTKIIPLMATFADGETVDRLLKLLPGSTLFNRCYVKVVGYKTLYNENLQYCLALR